MAGYRGTSEACAVLLGALAVLALAPAGCENETDLDLTPPAQVLDLSASAQSTCSIALTWTATGDDGHSGTSSAYELKYSTSVIHADNWFQAMPCEGLPEPSASGSMERCVVAGLVADTKYYFKMIVKDDAGNRSDLSNAGIARTLPPGSAPGVAWVRDGLAGDDQDWTNSASQLSAAWASVVGATGYQYSIGTSPGGREVVDWHTALGAEVTAAAHSGLALVPGGTYYFSVRALLEGGCSGCGTSDGITVDLGSPTSHVQPLASPACSTEFQVVWTGSDDLSGLDQYDIESRDGASGAWTTWISGTSDTSALFQGAREHVYYFRSLARDRAGNLEACPNDPDAWMSVMRAIPPVAKVSDGAGADDYWTNSSTELSAWWSPVEGAEGYEYGIGTDRAFPDLVGWTSVGNQTQMTHRGLSLVERRLYFVFVRALSGECRGPWGRSDGVRVDVTAPGSKVQALPETTYADAYQGQAQFEVHWNGGDALSGLAHYDVQSRAGLHGEWTDWRTGVTGWSSNFVGMVGTTYYFRCRATDWVGNTEPYPDGYDTFTLLLQPPPPPPPPPPINSNYKMALHMVRHGGASCRKMPVIESADGLTRVWHELDQDGFDVFFVVFDFDSILTLEFGLNWPEDWGTAELYTCGPVIQVGSIVDPGDGVALAYSTCQVPTTQGGTRPPFWTMCYAWMIPQSDGEIEVWPNPATGDLCVVDCRDPALRRKEHPVMIYNAGVNVDPWEGPPG